MRWCWSPTTVGIHVEQTDASKRNDSDSFAPPSIVLGRVMPFWLSMSSLLWDLISMLAWPPIRASSAPSFLSSDGRVEQGGEEALWNSTMGEGGVLSNFLNWVVLWYFQYLKVQGTYICKVPTFSNSFVLSEGNKEHIKRSWRNPFRIYINCISLVSKFVFVTLAAQLGWV